jgi:hypothetical protein
MLNLKLKDAVFEIYKVSIVLLLKNENIVCKPKKATTANSLILIYPSATLQK